MFRTKTLFIVGAGASCELGLPSGQQLKNIIADNINIRFEDGWRQSSGSHSICDALREHAKYPDGRAGDINPFLAAAWKIRDAMPHAISIDNFIEAHQNDKRVELSGKLGIVDSILSAERASNLYLRDFESKIPSAVFEKTWYGPFFQLLTENVKREEISQIFENITFVVFNYDRCLEHFLVNALQTYYALPDIEAQALVSRLILYHPYGAVGKLPWQDRSSGVPFGAKIDGRHLLRLANQIRTFTERIEEENILEEIRSLVQVAETVVFLGFAFHPMNMQLLKGRKSSAAKKVFWTSLGISSADHDEISAEILKVLKQKSQHVRISSLRNISCSDLFYEFRRSLVAS
ncbi:MAG: hypothetical protein KIT85_15950 [Pseudolabrys sp.]|nr:hypothetical protein [Pseudolabrys sp.]